LLHRRFHTALIAACPSHWILDFHETLFDLSDRVRHLSTREDRDSRDVKGEHQAIMEAVASRDTATAIELLNAHFSLTADIAIKAMDSTESAATGPENLIDLEAAKLRAKGRTSG
jgi:GntR family transcriptional regulator, carbon starvation induced regulator